MKSELITRSLTGILIVAVTLSAIVYSPYTYLAWLSIIAIIGTYEFFKIDLPQSGGVSLHIISLLFGCIVFTCGYFLLTQRTPFIFMIILPVMISFIVLLQLLTLNAPEAIVRKGKSIYAAASYIGLPLICGTLFLKEEYDFRFILIPVILIWTNDVGAYFFGSKWGTKKIKPTISPGKSMQGSIGGGFLVLLVAFIMYRLWPDVAEGYLITLALATPLIALAGDLWESALKRNAGVKDSGHFLPGHGGMLDRYDSLLFVLPLAALAYYIFVL